MYYVQYAHARICSLIARLAEEGAQVPKAGDVDAAVLNTPEELALIKALAQFPGGDPPGCPGTTIPAALTAIWWHWPVTSTALQRCRIKGEEPQVLGARLKLADTVRSVLANGMGPAGCQRTGEDVIRKGKIPF